MVEPPSASSPAPGTSRRGLAADRLVHALVGLSWGGGVREAILVGATWRLRRVPPWSAIWWRLPAEYARRERDGADVWRWVRIPRTRARLKVPVTSDFRCLFFDRVPYEPVTTAFITETLRPGDVFVDIGANLGYFTMLAAGLVGPRGRVLAVEPNPEPVRMLHESVRRNGWAERIRTVTAALCERDGGEVSLHVGAQAADSALSSIAPWSGHLASGRLTGERVLRVPARTLDAVARELSLDRMDLVKIDVEGAELRVLQGMCDVLRRLRPAHLVCETAPGSDVCDFLQGLGYRSRLIEPLHPQHCWGNVAFSRADRP